MNRFPGWASLGRDRWATKKPDLTEPRPDQIRPDYPAFSKTNAAEKSGKINRKFLAEIRQDLLFTTATCLVVVVVVAMNPL